MDSKKKAVRNAVFITTGLLVTGAGALLLRTGLDLVGSGLLPYLRKAAGK